jgi:hypothetical protein
VESGGEARERQKSRLERQVNNNCNCRPLCLNGTSTAVMVFKTIRFPLYDSDLAIADAFYYFCWISLAIGKKTLHAKKEKEKNCHRRRIMFMFSAVIQT